MPLDQSADAASRARKIAFFHDRLKSRFEFAIVKRTSMIVRDLTIQSVGASHENVTTRYSL